MAAGLPTIGTLVGGIPDFLTEGKTGLVCKPGNPRSIAQAILRAAALKAEEKKQLQQNTLAMIKGKYNWEYVAARLDSLFNQLLNI
jgi:glycosyltransferase involved in cell wall biosynthesis